MFIFAQQSALATDGSGWAQWIINVGVALAMLVYIARYFIPKLLKDHREEREKADLREDKRSDAYLDDIKESRVVAAARDDKFMELFEKEREARERNQRESTAAGFQQATSMVRLSESMDSLKGVVQSAMRPATGQFATLSPKKKKIVELVEKDGE